MSRLQCSYVISPSRSEKRCRICKEEHSLDFFRIRKFKRTYGKKEYYYFRSTCIFCKRKRDLEYKDKNRVEINKQKVEYRKNNLEKVKQQERESYQKNKEGKLDYQKEYNKRDYVKVAIQDRKHKRRAQKKVTDLDHKYLFTLKAIAIGFGNECPICKNKVDGINRKWWIEHSVPLSKNGTHTKDNIFYDCNKCNNTKKAKTLKEFIGLSQKEFIENSVKQL